MDQGLGKKERLKSKKETDLLFSQGNSLYSFPFKVVFKLLSENEQTPTTRVLVSVPKRNFKTAVDRNFLKRRIKEIYRKNKSEIQINSLGKSLALAIIYTHKEIRDFNDLEKGLILILRKLNLQLNSHK